MTVTLRPPMRFADPGRVWMAVTPAANASPNAGSCGQMECSAHTSAVLGAVASFPSESDGMPGDAYTPRWV